MAAVGRHVGAAFSIAVLVTSGACGGVASDLTADCVQGRRTQCSCDGARSGFAVCGSDGRFGACVCRDEQADASSPSDASGGIDAGDAAPFAFDIEDPKPCEREENVLYVAADPGSLGYPAYPDSPNPALSTVLRITTQPRPEGDQGVEFYVEPSGYLYGGKKGYIFSLRNLNTAIATGVVYDGAVKVSDFTSLKPIEEVFGTCLQSQTATGRFIFHSLERKPNLAASRFLVAFERRCQPSPATIRGCVHFDEKNPQ